MRRSFRAAVVALPLALMLPAPSAVADTILDADTMAVPADVAFGVVCPGQTNPTRTLPIGVRRNGNGQVFTSDQVLAVSSSAQTPLSLTAPSTLSIMPADITYVFPNGSVPHWGNIPSGANYVQRLTPAPVVTLVVPAFTPGAVAVPQSRNIDFTISGDRFNNPADLVLTDTIAVTYSLGSATDCAVADTEDPTISLSHGTPDGDDDWFVSSPVAVTVTAADNVGVVDIGCTDNGAPIDVVAGVLSLSGEGVHDLSCTAYDAAGNDATATDQVSIDTVAPELALVGQAEVTVDFGDPLPTYSCTASDATSGLVAPCTVAGDGNPLVGTHTVTATVTDVAGHTTTATTTYSVRAWTVDGFYRPVDMGLLNTVKAGSTVPLKFNVLKGDPGVPLTSGIGATFTVNQVTCDTNAEIDAIEEFATTGRTEMRYDADGAQWIQNWATPKTGAGKCFRVTLATADGSSIGANFKLK